MSSSRERLAFWAVFLATFGLALFYRGFAKIQLVGPLYILEVLLVVWAVSALSLDLIKQSFAKLRWLWLFFAYGVVRLGFEALFDPNFDFNVRTLQHCVLFIYPVAWATVGVWLGQRHWDQYRVLAGMVLVSLATLVLGPLTPWAPWFRAADLEALGLSPLHLINLAMGPLHVLVILWVLRHRPQWWKLIALGLFLTFYPFWFMWLGKMQRTSLLLLIFTLWWFPWISSVSSGRWKRAALESVGTTAVLILGFFVVTYVNSWSSTQAAIPQVRTPAQVGEEKPSLIEKAKKDFMASTSKGAEKYPFEAPVRKFMWWRAYQDGMQNPIFGIGLTPEVPSQVWDGYANKKGALPSPDEGDYPELPIAGPHNSYLSIFARFGVLGLGIFGVALFGLLPGALRGMRRGLSLEESIIHLLVVSGFIYSLVHSGLESPHNCLIFYVAWGILRTRS